MPWYRIKNHDSLETIARSRLVNDFGVAHPSDDQVKEEARRIWNDPNNHSKRESQADRESNPINMLPRTPNVHFYNMHTHCYWPWGGATKRVRKYHKGGNVYENYRHGVHFQSGQRCYEHPHQIIFHGGERIWLPDQITPPEQPERECIRYEITDNELKNGFTPKPDKDYELIVPVFRLQLEIDESYTRDDKFTLYSTDDEKYYKQTMTFDDNQSEVEEYLDLHFQGVRRDLNYTLEITTGSGEKYELFNEEPYDNFAEFGGAETPVKWEKENDETEDV